MRLFTERELKLIILGIGAATLVAVAFAMGVSISRNQSEAAGNEAPSRENRVLSVSDLQVPPAYRAITVSKWYIFRPRLKRWNAEQIERFWIDPGSVKRERLAAENDALILRLFEKIP